MIEVPEGWEIKPFSSLASINMGQSPESEFVNENQEGIAFLQGNADFGDINPKELYWVKVPKKLAKKDDILISVRAPVGDMNMADKEYCIGRGLSALTIKKINQKFGFYALFQERIQLDRLAQGSTFLAIGKNDFDKLLIKYPKEKKEQEKIAKILSTLDNAIESTTRIIEKEKNIKTALMQELLTNGIDKNGQIRTPQTHTYKQSELGLIPDEWEVDSIENHAKIITGDKDTQDRLDDGEYPFYVRSQTIERINTYSFDGEAVLTAGDGVGVGKVFHFVNEKFDFHQRVYCIHDFSEKLNSSFFFEYFRTYFIEQVNKYSAKGSVDSVRYDMIALMNIPLPTFEEQKQIAKILTTQDKKIEIEETNLDKLKELKKGLMNDLLSGVVRVKV